MHYFFPGSTTMSKVSPLRRAPHPENSAPRRPRALGRPQTTSREDIVARAIAILKADPEAGISINRTARALGLTPMALYTYFANRDELLQAVSARLLASLNIEVPARADWQQQIRCWAHGMRAHFLHYPYLMYALQWEGHISTAWLHQMVLVFAALHQAGFRGRALARAAVSVFRSTMGSIQAELAEMRAGNRFSTSDFAHLAPEQRKWLATLQRYSVEENHPDDAFRYSLERIIDGLCVEIGKSRRSRVRPKGR